jgi:predicted metal-dependent hydrolase
VPTYALVVPRALHRLLVTARVVAPRSVTVNIDYDFCECTLLGHDAQPLSCDVSSMGQVSFWWECGQEMVRKRLPDGGDTASTTPPPVNDPLAGLIVEIQRSTRRRRTISASINGDRLKLQVPAGLTAAAERAWAEKLGARILAARRKRELNTDDDLAVRAQELNERYFDGRLTFVSVRYVSNQQHRFGSCTPSTGAIRISDRLAKMPAWVRDAVLVHELSHLEVPSHNAHFWKLANRYPLMERARGYLMAVGLDDTDE